MSSTRSLRWPSFVAAILLVLTAATAAGAGGSVADGSVTWPISRDLLVSEVMTGGSSASDEFIELYNAGPVARDLAGLEVVYVTASGTTITRKASWSSTTDLGPGRHLLLANSAGLYAGMADGRYSGGLAATGGVIVLRSVGGAPIDALGWGEAGNTYVEGAAAVAPSAGASVERLPGALAGNGIDSNDNLGDTFLQPAPLPQPRTADPVPTPAPSGSPLPTVSPSATPRATPSLQPTVTPTLTPILTLPRESPTATLTPTAPTPTATAAATPSVTSDPTPDPTPSPTATATATAALSPSLSNTAVAPMPIATARTLPEGTEVAVEGTLTTPLGLLEMGKGAFVQDATAGMALYLASGDWPTLGMGSAVRIQGTIDSRYGQLTLRLAAAADVEGVDDRLVIQPFGTATGTAGEMLEGSLIAVTGTITTAPEPLSDGFALTIDDGSGALRVIAVTASGIPQWDLVRGSVVSLVGALGQRDSTGTGAGGYRLYLRSPKDVTILPAPSQSPTESPPPAPSATPTTTATRTTAPTPTWSSPTSPPTAHPTPSMISTATPTPDTLWSIASARILPLGTVVTIRGVATVPPGRLIDERTFFIQEGGAGIAVRLDVSPNGRSVSTGDLLQVHGVLAQRYGTLELRVGLEDEFTKLGTGRLPAPLIVTSAELGEVTEGRLVRLEGSLVGIDRSASGSVGLTLEDATGQARVFAFPALELSPERFERGQLLAAVGIAGQRSSGRDRPDGYRVWPRDGSDLLILEEADPDPSASPPPTARPRPDPSPRPRPTPPPDPAPSPIPIARALGVTDRDVTIVGTVTTPVGLLDAERRRVVLDDGTAAVLVRLVKKDRGPRIGDRLRVTGRVGTYYGAPQLGAEETAVHLGVGIVPQPLRVTAAPLRQVLEWRLAQVSGMITSLERHGESWRAEIALPGGGSVPVSASARSKTPATVLTEGSAATVVGIVRRPVSSARDQRFSLLPRSRADVRGAGRGSSHGGNGGPAGGSEPGTGAGDPGGGAGTSGDAATASDGAGSGGGSRSFVGATGRADTAVRDVELRDLSRHIGRRVRVGGFVARSTALRVTLEDASSTVPVLLPDTARALVGMLRSREVINVTGLVRAAAKGPELVLTDPADLVRVGSLEVVSLAAVPGATPDGSSSPAPAAVTPAASVDRRSGPPLLPILLFLGASAVGFAALGWRVTSLRRSSEPSATAGRSLGLPRTGGADG